VRRGSRRSPQLTATNPTSLGPSDPPCNDGPSQSAGYRSADSAASTSVTRRHPGAWWQLIEDERKFATVARVSEVKESLYRAFLQPWVRAMVGPQLADAAWEMHLSG
jgi:Protein of unknown function (DUF3141)